MRLLRRTTLRVKLAILGVALVGAAAAWAGSADEAPFLVENDAAVARMMAAMHIKPSGDVDRDFAAMMSAHHQGAIDMARAHLRYGRNEALRRLSHEIMVTQRAEIAAMRLAIGEPPPADPSTAPPHALDRSPLPERPGSPVQVQAP